MSILTRNVRRIKPVRPVRPFGEGLEPDTSPLPSIDGSGLSKAECFRINGAMNRVRAAYAVECPDADALELDRIAKLAGKDELRRLLKDRPAAPCCDAAEAVPCLTCAPAPSIEPELDDEPEYASAEEWPAWTDGERWEAGPENNRLTFAELVERESRRFRAWDNGAGLAIAKNLDELANAIRYAKASTPEELEARLEVLDEDLRAMSDAWEPEPELTASGRWA